MKKPEAVLLDLGGTLLHLDYPFVSSEFRRLGWTVEEEPFFQTVARTNRYIDEVVTTDPSSTDASRWQRFFEFFLNDLNAPIDHAEFIETVLRPRHAEVNLWNYVLPGTDEVLRELKKEYRLALISNSDGRAGAKAAQYGLREYLEIVVDSHAVGVEKPDPRIFQITCGRMGVAPSNCVYVGDIYSIDVVGPRAAGILPILLDRSMMPRDDCIVLKSLFDVPATLRGLSQGGVGEEGLEPPT